MNYMIRVIDADGECITVTYSDEHPHEDFLRELAELHEGSYCDVCRNDTI